MIDYKKYDAITKTTKDITNNCVYFCFVGERFDGHDFVGQALAAGASLVVGTKDIENENYYKVDDINHEFSKASQIMYDYPSNSSKIIAVTGTDGKTSVATLTHLLLNRLSTSSYLGTSGLIVNEDVHGYNGMTTPFANNLFKYLNIADQATDNFVLEISSHGLEQERVYGLKLDVCGFTNLTNDHLDFHKTIDNYFATKAKILDYLKEDGYFVCNTDDDYGQKLFNKCQANKYSYGTNGADFLIKNIKTSIDGNEFEFDFNDKTYAVQSCMLASFNVFNLMHAIINVYVLGYELDTILSQVSDLSVDGRMEVIKGTDTPYYVLDFAHTSDSIGKVTSFLSGLKKGCLIVVGGSAGGRDHSKREKMGEMMSQGADLVVLTEDDPRDESVFEICRDLSRGIDDGISIIIDKREQAIQFATSQADKNDIILLLGKAGQTLMYYDGFTSDYIERDVVTKIIKEHNEGH